MPPQSLSSDHLSDESFSSDVLSPKRRWAFRLIAIGLAVLPFVIAELYLRSASIQTGAISDDLSSDPVFDTREVPPLFVASGDGKRMEVPPTRLNFFRPASFSIDKPSGTKRVFVLGGSTVQGRPYETETSLTKWIELRLQAADPTHEYEVINCGGVSYASYRVSIILDQVLDQSPDAIVVYTGHNEYLEERSYNTVNQSALDRLANRIHLVRALQRFQTANTKPTQLSSEVETRLDLQDGMKRYTRDPHWRHGVEDHFRVTLQSMIAKCTQAGVPMVLCLPASDLVETPPFKVEGLELDHATKTRFAKSLEVARDTKADFAARRIACQQCLEIDPGHAGVNYLLGRLHYDRGESAEALESLTKARDLDVCPLRATTPLLNHIEDLAAQEEVVLVRCDRLLDQLDSKGRRLPDGIPDPSRFADHIHPTIKGHQEIARAVTRHLALLFGTSIETPRAKADYEMKAQEHLQSLGTVYFERGKKRLEGLKNWAAGRAGK